VVPEASGLTETQMQLIAREMNLSETAFVFPDSAADFHVRFFTPTQEVDLCGHATVATFWLLASLERLASDREHFTQRTRAGLLAVTVERRQGLPVRVMMEQAPPRLLGTVWAPPTVTATLRELATLLGTQPDILAASSLPLQVISTGVPDLLVPLPSREVLDALRPDHKGLAAWCRARGVLGVHAFCLGGTGPVLVHARNFAPAAGIPEESATGTASGALGAYLWWSRVVPLPPAGPDGTAVLSFLAEQGHIMGRKGEIHVEVTASRDAVWRVRVGGRAVEVLAGEIFL